MPANHVLRAAAIDAAVLAHIVVVGDARPAVGVSVIVVYLLRRGAAARFMMQDKQRLRNQN